MAINFFDFEGRLCTAVPWQGKNIVRFFDYILRANPDVSEKHLKDYVPMYIGDLRDRFREEEINYLKWMSSNIQLMQDMNNIIKSGIKKIGNLAYGYSIPADFFYEKCYAGFLNISTNDILKKFGIDGASYFNLIDTKIKDLVAYSNYINKRNKYLFFKMSRSAGHYYIEILPLLRLESNLRFYLTVKPNMVSDLSLFLAKEFLKIAHKEKKRLDFKLARDFRADTIVVYGGNSTIDLIKNLDNNWFLNFQMPFTKKIGKGRGVAVDINRNIANKLNIPLEVELSNGAILCYLISKAFNEFSRKMKRYPHDEHENLGIILNACYGLFKHNINLGDISQ